MKINENNKQLLYNCNAIQSWYATLITVAVLHVTGLFPLSHVMDHFGSIMTVAVLFADAVSIVTYVATIVMKKQHRMSGNLIYDFFMGMVM